MTFPIGATRGISDLNADATAAQVFALSGASSVPGLSSISVADLARDMEMIDEIDIAILPGNRAPRGLSVIRSIVSGVGRPYHVLREGIWREIHGWTDRREYTLAPGLNRVGYSVDVPDISLLPGMTGAQTVNFRAGLELPIMNWSLVLLARLRQRWLFELPEWAYDAVHLLSKVLYPLGTDRGGMLVSVRGRSDNQNVCRTWTLVADNGDGPFVPGTLCRAILRNPEAICAGARSCLAELPRTDVEAAMCDLQIETTVHRWCNQGSASGNKVKGMAPTPTYQAQ
ncbi:hypothetical protein KHP62_13590 [Rhodobacteraceae bacterium NNCM2]|nr:hypothetical protein [Coraliihabitans acroporae]